MRCWRGIFIVPIDCNELTATIDVVIVYLLGIATLLELNRQ